MQNLIERMQNFTLNRKVLSIDSNDRNINKFPNSSLFEIDCPNVYTNIESIRLLNITFPNKLYNISEYLQNNKLIIDFQSNEETIILNDGYYTPELLEIALNNKLQELNNNFLVKYNSLNKKFYIGNTNAEFTLNFKTKINYTNCNNNNNVDIYLQPRHWGLGYILGFNKENITSVNNSDTNNYKFITDPSNNNWIANGSHIIISNNTCDLNGYNTIYMEVESLNSSDEIKPYSISNFTNTNIGLVNSFFAKIPYSNEILNFYSKDYFLESVSFYQPPLEKISKLKIKFRYHNGLLVDLLNNNVVFSFEINQIRNEIKDYNVRKPLFY